MPFFIRAIRQTRWFKYPAVEWLTPGDAPKDLGTDEGALSLFQVDDEGAKWRAIAALAANRQSLDLLDYSWFDGSNFGLYGIVANKVPGATPDTTVDERHHNLVNLSARKVAHLADIVSTGTMGRVQKTDVKDLIKKGIDSRNLDRGKVKPGVLKALQVRMMPSVRLGTFVPESNLSKITGPPQGRPISSWHSHPCGPT